MLDKKDVVSVIIPTYNRQDMLFEALASVLTQVYVNIEVLVIDNMSDDHTLARLAQLSDPRVKVLTEARRGAAAARNAGIRAATGEFLAFLDSDDLWLPTKLAVQVERIKTLNSPSLIFAEYREFLTDQPDGVLRGNTSKMSLSLITMLMRKADFHHVGLFDHNLQTGEFLEWYARALRLGMKPSIIDQVLSLRRIHPGNSASNARGARDYINACRAIIANRSKP